MTRATAVAYLAVVAGAATPWLEVAVVVPAAIALGLHPAAVVALAFVGNAATLLAVLVLADRLRARRGPARRSPRLERVWSRWGLPGVAVVAPISVGTHLGAVAVVAMGTSRRHAAAWMLAGLAVWTVAFGVLASLGLAAL